MGRELGLSAIGVWEYSLYGGTIMLAFGKEGGPFGGQADTVTAMVERELDEGITDPAYVGSLGTALDESVAAIKAYLTGTTSQGLKVTGYGAASRTSALLCSAEVTKEQVVAVADAATGQARPDDAGQPDPDRLAVRHGRPAAGPGPAVRPRPSPRGAQGAP